MDFSSFSIDSVEEELPIILLKEYKLSSHVSGYHAYMTIWELKNGEFLEIRLEPKYELDKYVIAVIKNSLRGLTFSERKYWSFRKNSFFLRASNDNSVSCFSKSLLYITTTACISTPVSQSVNVKFDV